LSSAGGARVAKFLAVVNASLIAAYPLAVYFGLLHLGARSLGLLLMLLLLPGLALKWRHARREDRWAVARVPLSVLALVALAALFDEQRFVLALPVLINMLLLVSFASSLRGTPLVERFARMQDPELGPEQVRYCRAVTVVWCIFFVLNGALSAALALFASVGLWALYTGLVAYVLIGLLATAEYVVRKARFREYGAGLHDRLLARVFPPRAHAGAVRSELGGRAR
jgi:uncharacterized membrane protein